ncbi:MAG: hypothetical protein HN356_01550 [Calditrichaeota bacterium]|nr:hypothetical protein [Calditrichota bacterium]MBT7788163.1 hypothetical protein [Calditrichota bacterium]
MKRLINQRPGILILPESKLIFKPEASLMADETTDEVKKAITEGWLKIDKDESETLPVKTGSETSAHDWEVDYTRIEENVVMITDKISCRSVTGEILEKKGEQHFTLKDIGTVKKQQFWPKAQALEQFDGTE